MGLCWSRTPPCIATMGPFDITLPPAVMSRAVTMALPRLGVGQMAGDWAMSVGHLQQGARPRMGTEGQDRLGPTKRAPTPVLVRVTIAEGVCDKDRKTDRCRPAGPNCYHSLS